MKILSRLVCMAVGHKQYPTTSVPPTPKPKAKPIPLTTAFPSMGWTSAANLSAGLTATGNCISLSGGLTATRLTSSPLIQISSFPHDAKMYICCRCHSVFWHVGLQQGTLCNSDKIPELEEWRKIKERAVWEQKQRQANSVANKLYKQYLMTLKLGYDEDASDEQA